MVPRHVGPDQAFGQFFAPAKSYNVVNTKSGTDYDGNYADLGPINFLLFILHLL